MPAGRSACRLARVCDQRFYDDPVLAAPAPSRRPAPLSPSSARRPPLVTRGHADARAPEGAEILHADARDSEALAEAIGDRTFDAVVDWPALDPEHVEDDLRLFRGRKDQYVFLVRLGVSDAAALAAGHGEHAARQPRVGLLPGQDRVRGPRLEGARRRIPVTVVRPSHTYAPWTPPFRGGYTLIDRLRRGAPVLVHGDGLSLWTLTHHRDFARGFVGLLGNDGALGRAVHITSDEILTWDAIVGAVAEAWRRGQDRPRAFGSRRGVDADWGDSLLGDKAHARVSTTPSRSGSSRTSRPRFRGPTALVR